MASVFTTLFEGVASSNYGSMSDSMRTLFDAMLGNYSGITMSSRQDLHNFLRIIHIIASNIFLLNYLIAILSSAYEYMRDIGEFDYKSNKYAFVEKYQNCLQCKRRFGELVLTPAPFNVFNIIILPFALVPNSFKHQAEIFSKIMFWVDNIFFIIVFFIYSWVLVPIIFFKVLVNFLRSTSILKFIPLALLWICLGFLFLPIYVFRDLAYFVLILCRYGDAEDQTMEKFIEEMTQDRIVVFNEIMDVMIAIKLLFKSTKKPKQTKTFYRSQTQFMNFQKLQDDEDKSEKILINKELVVQAWMKYRPNDSLHEFKEEDTSTAAMSNKNFLTVIDESFIKKIIDNVNQNNNNIDFDDEGSDASVSQHGFRDKNEVPENELKMIHDFLNRFLITSISHQKDKVDLVLALRALPKHINENNVNRINLINFGAIRQSLNALRNDDNRGLKRFLNLWSRSKENTEEVNGVKELVFRVIYKVSKLLDIDPTKMFGMEPDDERDYLLKNDTSSNL